MDGHEVVDLAVGRLALHDAENPDEVIAALDDKTEAVIREPEVAVEDPEVGRFVAAVAVGSRVISESSVRVRMMPAYPTPVDLRCPICMSVLR